MAKPHQDKQERMIFTTKECIKMQRYKIRTRDTHLHGATKEIKHEQKGGRERRGYQLDMQLLSSV